MPACTRATSVVFQAFSANSKQADAAATSHVLNGTFGQTAVVRISHCAAIWYVLAEPTKHVCC